MGRILVAAVVAVVAGVYATKLEKTFDIPEDLKKYSAPFPPGILEKIDAAQAAVDLQNHGLVGALIGAALCACLGAAAVAPGGLLAGVIGAISGAVLGGCGGAASTVLYKYLMLHPIDPFVDGVLVQASFTVAVAAALALTVFLAGRRSLNSSVPAVLVVVGVIGAVFYPFLAAIIFPVLKSHQPLPEGLLNRGLWLGLPVVLYALTLIRSRRTASGQPAAAESTTEAAAAVQG